MGSGKPLSRLAAPCTGNRPPSRESRATSLSEEPRQDEGADRAEVDIQAEYMTAVGELLP